MVRDGTMFNSANDNIVHGNVDNFQSHNTIQIKNTTYYGRYPELRSFLSPLDPDSRHSTIREKLIQGTGQWLLNSQRFREWKDGKNGPQVICLLGEPGIGKSSLFCHIVDNLRSEEKAYSALVASVYCDYQDQGRHTARNLVGTLLSQIIVHLPNKTQVIKELEERRKCNRSLATDECVTFLRQALNEGKYNIVWLGLDALDELDSQERDKLLRELSIICRFSIVRIFLTGRSNAGVDNSIEHSLLATVVEYVSISAEDTSEDICRFLEQRLRDDSNPSLMDDKLRIAIFDQLAGSDSTFLLATLNIGKVLLRKTIRKREKALNDLVLNLDTSYEEMINRIKRQDEDYGIKILHWIFFALRPLTLQELRYAVAIEPGTSDFEPSRDLPASSIVDLTLGLATVDWGYWGQTVRFVHFTFKEHLFRNFTLHFPRGHALLAEATLTYLSFDAMNTSDGRRRYETGGDLHAFRAYATENWGIHARKQEDDYVVGEVCTYLKSDMFEGFRLLDDLRIGHIGLLCARLWWTSPLHAVSYFGLSATLTRLMSPGSRAGDTLNSRRGTSTQRWDVEFPHASPALEDTSADPTASGSALDMSQCHLVRANTDMKAPNGNEPDLIDIHERLLGQQNFDINCADRYGWTPLLVALEAGHTKIAKQLLEWEGVDVNLRVHGGGHQSEECCFFSRTPLLLALDNSQLEIVKLLLERQDIEVNLSDRDGRTPLSVAMNNLHFGIMTQILRRNDISPDHLGAALCEAISADHREIAKNLLERENINVNFQRSFHQSPLSIAARRGNLELVTRLLQRKDINANFPDQLSDTPLFIALDNDHVEIAKKLLEQEAINVNLQNRYGWTPLHIAIAHGHLGIARRLLERDDIDVNLADRFGQTALCLAVSHGHQEIVPQFLLCKDIDVNFSKQRGQTPLSIALLNNRVESAKMLLEREDINVNLPDKQDRTPYSIALAKGHHEIAGQLLERMSQ